MSDDNSLANDNEPPSRLDNLVAVTIEDFLIAAEGDAEDDEEPIAAGPALTELAAAAVVEIFFEYQKSPKLILSYVAGRVYALLRAHLERSELLERPHLAVVKDVPEG